MSCSTHIGGLLEIAPWRQLISASLRGLGNTHGGIALGKSIRIEYPEGERHVSKGKVYLTGNKIGPPTFDQIIAMTKRLTGRDPTPEEFARAKAKWDAFCAQKADPIAATSDTLLLYHEVPGIPNSFRCWRRRRLPASVHGHMGAATMHMATLADDRPT